MFINELTLWILHSSDRQIKLKNVHDPIPSGWRLINFSELEKYKSEAKRVMGYWTIAKIGEGYRFSGRGWGYKIKTYGSESITQKLLIEKTGKIFSTFFSTSFLPRDIDSLA